VLAQCPALAHLDLSYDVELFPGLTGFEHYHGIGAAGAESFAGVLAQCAALAHLNLSGNEIGDSGAESLARVLGRAQR